MIKLKNKADILTENIIFLIIVVVFFTIMFIFISRQASSEYLLEEKTAKQLTLIIDASRPGTEIMLNLKKVLKEAEKNEIQEAAAVKIDSDANLVFVKLSEKSGYSYGFFNDVNVEYKIENDFLIMEIK